MEYCERYIVPCGGSVTEPAAWVRRQRGSGRSMSRDQEIEIFIKLPSIPAIVVLSAVGNAKKITEQLRTTGHRARTITPKLILVEEQA